MFKRFTAGMAVGYVLGARAGTKRYDQITELADRALEVPGVRRAASAGQSAAVARGREVLEEIRRRAQWHDADEDEDDADVQDDEDEDEADDDEDDDDEDEADDEDDDDDVHDEADDDDDEDDDEDEEEEGEDVYDEDEDDDEDDEEEEDDEEAEDNEATSVSRHRSGRKSQDDGKSGRGTRRRGVGAVASAARERGRVS